MAKILTFILTVSKEDTKFQQFLEKLYFYQDKGYQIYVFCLDEGVKEIDSLTSLFKGIAVFGCAYATQARSLPIIEKATYGGLGLLADLIVESDIIIAF
ncbi:hypothetical protein [Methylacidiphilum caldifontis]|uniref:Sulfur reduction protein DsrE n=1 Tax=Methylacidiphilum caldifontis TaxID=2795386 RepID=A0A4Y8PGB1_9BACT|nr:hypothetical protein [Methylacidiphilum caldifontis]QSR88351.1 hypothetical protein IT6_08195 [Methylacidiphilum caldifontis]TFE70658.1 hypothetical protein A7Q10_06205 [Methylacidiphilum caldifontis]